MDISAKKNELDASRPGQFLATWMTFRGMVGKLIGFFRITDDERLKAGVYVRGEGRDE